MTLQELAGKEDVLCRKVGDIYRQTQSDQTHKMLQDVFYEYRQVHQTYAELSLTDNEALKRGLFIQWYALVEPNYLTGIADLDESAENKIVQALNDRIESGKLDNELIWMLNYFANWDWIFERLASFKGFDNIIMNEQNGHLPDKIDSEDMSRRGQMGKYWNSLTKFRDV